MSSPEARAKVSVHGYEREARRAAERGTPAERFWRQVEKTETCWLWTGALTYNGYGRFLLGKHKEIRAHRFAWIEVNGRLPNELRVCHSCDVTYSKGDITYRRCVRESHLFAGTDGDNMRDAAAKGRMWTGPRHPMSAETKAKLSLAKKGKPVKRRRDHVKGAATSSIDV